MFGNFFSGGNKPTPNGQNPQAAQAAQSTQAPAQAPAPEAAKPQEAPMDQFKDLWATQAPAKAAPSALDLDVQTVAQSAGQLDFTKVVRPEVMQKISAGGPEANAAFLQAMSSIAQATTAHSQLAAADIMKQALAEQKKSLLQEFKSQSAQQSAFDGLRAENPMMSHPSVQPIVSAVQAQLQIKHPNATSQELRDMTKDYMQRFADVMNPKAPPKNAKQEMNWADWVQ